MQVRAAQRRGGLVLQPIRRGSPGWRRVGSLGEAAQPAAGSCDALYRAHQVGQGPGQADQPRHDQDIARLQAPEQAIQLGLHAAVFCPRLLLHELPASVVGRRPAVCAEFAARLVAGLELADQHCARPPRSAAGQGRAPRPYGTPLGPC